jgi:hypothetical protein
MWLLSKKSHFLFSGIPGRFPREMGNAKRPERFRAPCRKPVGILNQNLDGCKKGLDNRVSNCSVSCLKRTKITSANDE